MPMNDRYTYRVTWSEEDGEYVGICVEFPSLSWLAPTPEAALAGIRRVVTDVVADMEAGGERIPKPIALGRHDDPMKQTRSDVYRHPVLEAAEPV